MVVHAPLQRGAGFGGLAELQMQLGQGQAGQEGATAHHRRVAGGSLAHLDGAVKEALGLIAVALHLGDAGLRQDQVGELREQLQALGGGRVGLDEPAGQAQHHDETRVQRRHILGAREVALGADQRPGGLELVDGGVQIADHDVLGAEVEVQERRLGRLGGLLAQKLDVAS
jgi:hypothetical protein